MTLRKIKIFETVSNMLTSGQLLAEEWTTKLTHKEFTYPLGLHRILDSVAVCPALIQIGNSETEWTKTEGYSHCKGWNQFEIGEADSLMERGFQLVGKCRVKTVREPELVRAIPVER